MLVDDKSKLIRRQKSERIDENLFQFHCAKPNTAPWLLVWPAGYRWHPTKPEAFTLQGSAWVPGPAMPLLASANWGETADKIPSVTYYDRAVRRCTQSDECDSSDPDPWVRLSVSFPARWTGVTFDPLQPDLVPALAAQFIAGLAGGDEPELQYGTGQLSFLAQIGTTAKLLGFDSAKLLAIFQRRWGKVRRQFAQLLNEAMRVPLLSLEDPHQRAEFFPIQQAFGTDPTVPAKCRPFPESGKALGSDSALDLSYGPDEVHGASYASVRARLLSTPLSVFPQVKE